MGNAGKEQAQMFAWPHISDQYLEIYHSVAAQTQNFLHSTDDRVETRTDIRSLT
jgi:hypothetical protein